jgi:hypothetical protein
MRGIAIATVLVLLSIECHAQGMGGPGMMGVPGMMAGPGMNGPNPGQCEQVRGAIQQYGLEAARKHAMANYNLKFADLRNIEHSCGIGERRDRRARQ